MKNNDKRVPFATQFHSLYEVWANHIPLVNAMELKLRESETGWFLEAPLEPNSNHMGTGFGGSIAAIATLAGWAQTWMLLPHPNDVHIVVAKSNIHYKKPVLGPLVSTAVVPPDADIDRFLHRLDTRGRGAINVTTRVHSNGVEAATLTGKFVAAAKSDND